MREYPLSVRPLNVGFGAGDVGFGFRAGSAVEFWVNDLFGVGLQGGVTEQRMLFGPMSGAAFVEPTVGMRSSPHSGTYLVATLGVGYARGQYDSGSGFCVLSPCSSPVKYSYDGHAVSAAAGVLFHPGRGYFELGPSLRLDAIGGDVLPKDTLFTLNFEVGFALPRR